MKTMTSPYDVAEQLRTPEKKEAYLEACIEEADGGPERHRTGPRHDQGGERLGTFQEEPVQSPVWRAQPKL